MNTLSCLSLFHSSLLAFGSIKVAPCASCYVGRDFSSALVSFLQPQEITIPFLILVFLLEQQRSTLAANYEDLLPVLTLLQMPYQTFLNVYPEYLTLALSRRRCSWEDSSENRDMEDTQLTIDGRSVS